MKIRIRLAAAEKIREHGEQQRMKCSRRQRMKSAYDHVERNPYNREPTRPVVAPQHKDSSNNRQQPDNQREHNLVRKGVSQIEFGCVRRNATDAGDYIDPAYDRYRNGTLPHACDCLENIHGYSGAGTIWACSSPASFIRLSSRSRRCAEMSRVSRRPARFTS